MILYHRNIAKPVAHAQQQSNPQQRPHKIVHHEFNMIHVTHARHKWRERANDRHKARDNNGLGTIFFIEAMRL